MSQTQVATAQARYEMNNAHKFMDHAARYWRDGDTDRARFWLDAAKAHPGVELIRRRIARAEQVMADAPAATTEPEAAAPAH